MNIIFYLASFVLQAEQESVDKLQNLAQLYFWTSQTKYLLAQGTESLENRAHGMRKAAIAMS